MDRETNLDIPRQTGATVGAKGSRVASIRIQAGPDMPIEDIEEIGPKPNEDVLSEMSVLLKSDVLV